MTYYICIKDSSLCCSSHIWNIKKTTIFETTILYIDIDRYIDIYRYITSFNWYRYSKIKSLWVPGKTFLAVAPYFSHVVRPRKTAKQWDN